MGDRPRLIIGEDAKRMRVELARLMGDKYEEWIKQPGNGYLENLRVKLAELTASVAQKEQV